MEQLRRTEPIWLQIETMEIPLSLLVIEMKDFIERVLEVYSLDATVTFFLFNQQLLDHCLSIFSST